MTSCPLSPTPPLWHRRSAVIYFTSVRYRTTSQALWHQTGSEEHWPLPVEPKEWVQTAISAHLKKRNCSFALQQSTMYHNWLKTHALIITEHQSTVRVFLKDTYYATFYKM